MTELLKLGVSITCHAFNKDRTQLALCPNANEIHIYQKQGNEWNRTQVLEGHDQVVTGIDWGHKTNRIVSSSSDRNAYVWTLEGTQWKPVLVILRVPRSATSVRWSPNEDKFAVSSSAKCVCICFFDQDNNWWVSRIIKKHKSTVLSVEWHPNNIFILTACSDKKTRVFSAWTKNIDAKPGDTAFGNKLPFGEPLACYDSLGWVHNAVWSASGNRFAFVSHNSTITFVDVSQGAPGVVQIVDIAFLPLSCLMFVNENTVVAGGHDCSPLVFTNTGGTWAFSNLIQEKKDATAQKTGGTKQAFELFKNKVEVGANTNVQNLSTVHQNCITCLFPFQVQGTEVKQFTTSGLDGKLVLWNV